jgi:hypothetical protein
MTKKQVLSGITSAATVFLAAATPVMAEITNPVISPKLGSNSAAANSGDTFASYFITIWRALIVIGALALLFNLINGAIEWVTAGGEKGKVEHARQKMTNAVVGMVILASTFAIISFISNLFGFNLLQLTIPTP